MATSAPTEDLGFVAEKTDELGFVPESNDLGFQPLRAVPQDTASLAPVMSLPNQPQRWLTPEQQAAAAQPYNPESPPPEHADALAKEREFRATIGNDPAALAASDERIHQINTKYGVTTLGGMAPARVDLGRETPLTDSAIDKVAAGAYNALSGAVGGVTDENNLMLLPVAGSTLTKTLFTALMAKGSAESALEFKRRAEAGDLAGATEYGLTALGLGLGAKSIAGEVLRDVNPARRLAHELNQSVKSAEIPPLVQQVADAGAPLTAKALDAVAGDTKTFGADVPKAEAGFQLATEGDIPPEVAPSATEPLSPAPTAPAASPDSVGSAPVAAISSEPTGSGAGEIPTNEPTTTETPPAGNTEAPPAAATPGPGPDVGQAGPVEGGGEAPNLTGIRNAVTDKIREAMGMPERATPETYGAEQQIADAQKAIEANPDLGRTIVEDLKAGERQLDTLETGVLTHELAARLTKQEEAAKALNEAPDDVAARDRMRAADQAVQDVVEVATKAGTGAGRALEARKRMIDQQYTLPVELAKQQAKKGEQLTPEEFDALKAKVAQHADLTEQLRKATETQAENDRLKAHNEELQKLLAEAGVKKKPATKPKAPESDETVYTPKKFSEKAIKLLDEQADAALKRIREKLMRANVGVDPTLIADAVIYGGSKLAKVAIKKGVWVHQMVGELGEWVKPHLDEIWDAAKAKLESGAADEARDIPAERAATLEKMKERVKEDGDGPADLSRYARQLAKQFIHEGIHELEPLTDAVHGALKEVFPDITRTESRDAWTGFGKWKPASTDPEAKILGQRASEGQTVSKIELALQGKPSPKTGQERFEQTDAKRNLEKQWRDLTKKLGIQVKDPARQLKSALDAIKTRLRNAKADLDFAVATGKRIAREKGGVPYDEEARGLKAARDAAKEDYDRVFPKEPITPEEQLRRATAIAERNADRWRAKVEDAKKGIFEAGDKTSGPTSEKIKQFKAEAEASKAEVDLLKSLDQAQQEKIATKAQADELARNEAAIKEIDRKIAEGDLSKGGGAVDRPAATAELEASKQRLQDKQKELRKAQSEARPRKSDVEISLQARKAAGLRRIAELERRRVEQDFGPRPKREPPVAVTPEEKQLQAEVDAITTEKAKVEKSLERDKEVFRLAHREKWEKELDELSGWSRGFKLTRVATLAKLALFSIGKLAATPIHEAAGGLYSKLPGYSKLSNLASIEGRYSGSALRAFYKGFFGQGMKDAAANAGPAISILTRGRYGDPLGMSDLKAKFGGKGEAAYGAYEARPPRLYDVPQMLHEIEKSPLRRAIFEMSAEKLFQHAKEIDGRDITDPAVKEDLLKQAYRQSSRGLLLADNKMSTFISRGIASLEEKSKHDGKVTVTGKLGSTLAKALTTFNKVGANHFVESVVNTTLGFPIGQARFGVALLKGIEQLHPEDANSIMRQLKMGTPAAAMFALGVLLPAAFGGLDPRKKRQDGDLKFGEAEIAGIRIPKVVSMAVPPLIAAQLGATFTQTANSYRRKKDSEPRGVVSGIGAVAAGALETGPVVNEAARLDEFFDVNQREKYVGDWLRSNFEPGLISEIADGMDKDANGETVRRKASNLLEYLELGIPGARNTLDEKKKTK